MWVSWPARRSRSRFSPRWAESGVPWRSAPALVLLAARPALAVPWATRKPLYCHQLCPHGAAQELLGHFAPRRWRHRGAQGFRRGPALAAGTFAWPGHHRNHDDSANGPRASRAIRRLQLARGGAWRLCRLLPSVSLLRCSSPWPTAGMDAPPARCSNFSVPVGRPITSAAATPSRCCSSASRSYSRGNSKPSMRGWLQGSDGAELERRALRVSVTAMSTGAEIESALARLSVREGRGSKGVVGAMAGGSTRDAAGVSRLHRTGKADLAAGRCVKSIPKCDTGLGDTGVLAGV